jgi:hypothetical protein
VPDNRPDFLEYAGQSRDHFIGREDPLAIHPVHRPETRHPLPSRHASVHSVPDSGIAEPTAHPEWDQKQAKAELELLQGAYKTTLRDHTGAVVYSHKKPVSVDLYLTHRNAFLGAGFEYQRYLEFCRNELDAKKAWLRDQIEPGGESRRRFGAKWREAQDVFYAWVRRAYEKELGADADIPALIRAGNVPEIAKVKLEVKTRYGIEKVGGANPRPRKKLGAYRLGTLSDHALGKAIDVSAASNKQFTSSQWAAVENFTGGSLPKAKRVSLWASDPAALHAEISAMNEAFVEKLNTSIAAHAARGSNAGDSVAKAISEVSKGDAAFWRGCSNGFFSLPLQLVLDLHAAGLKWGAVFPSPDLHHFELPEKAK